MRSFLRKLMRTLLGDSYNTVRNSFFGNQRTIRGKGNKLSIEGRLKNVSITIKGNNNTIAFKAGSYVMNTMVLVIGDGHQLEIGENCIFRAGELWMENTNCKLIIGDNTTVVEAHLAVTEPDRQILIGKNCMFSRDIEFRTGDSHSIIDITTGAKINDARDIVVGDHVWVGARVTVLKGVTVGENSILGTGSIVTSNVPRNTIVAGVPAKVVRENISWSRDRMVNPATKNRDE